MTTPAAYPRSQHWTVDGFRVTVLLYSSHVREQCATCGERGAIHCVWADHKTNGYSGGVLDFCDAHRPTKGTLPELDYRRFHHDGLFFTTERLTPSSEWRCDTCGEPARFHDRPICHECDDPAHMVTRVNRVLSLDGERTERRVEHEQHTILETFECDQHRLPAEPEQG